MKTLRLKTTRNNLRRRQSYAKSRMSPRRAFVLYTTIFSLLRFRRIRDPKPSKTVQKRAAKAARLQQQQQQHETKTLTGSKSNTAKISDEIVYKPNGSVELNLTEGHSKLMSPPPSAHSTASIPTTPGAHRTRSRSPPATATTFQPNLPPLPTPSEMPIVRKRKASQDLTSNPLRKESKVELADAAYIEDAVDGTVLVPSSQQTNEEEKAKKLRNVGTRTLWTLIMISGFLSRCSSAHLCLTSVMDSMFIALLAMGHAYMIILVLLCQSVVYREVTSLFTLRGESESKDPWRKTLNWYFFAVTNYFLYGESIIYYFKVRRFLVSDYGAM